MRFDICLQRLGRDRRASVVIWFALAVPTLVVLAAAATDYGWLALKRVELQQIADAAATGAAKELALAGRENERVIVVAREIATAGLSQAKLSSQIDAKVVDNYSGVSVSLSATVTLPMPILGQSSVVGVNAVAHVGKAPPVCMVSLDPDGSKAVNLQDAAMVTAPGCGIYDNSRSSDGLAAQGRAQMRATTICTVGGVTGSASFTPSPITDCPTLEDPLAGRKQPALGRCDHTETVVVRRQSVVLNPGVYCGGLIVEEGGVARLNPGIYTIRFGLAVAAGGTLQGTGVGFFLTGQSPSNVSPFSDRTTQEVNFGAPWLEAAVRGEGYVVPRMGQECELVSAVRGLLQGGQGLGGAVNAYRNQVRRQSQPQQAAGRVDASARIYFDVDSTIDLAAPKDGPLAGILFFEDRSNTLLIQHQIISDNARNLLGTVYLSRGLLAIASTKRIAEGSAYTIIVARRVFMNRSANLYLNSNYSRSDVPVPEGVGPIAKVYLTH